MNRRGVLKLFSAGAVTALVGQVAWHVRDTAEPLLYEDIVTTQLWHSDYTIILESLFSIIFLII